jgi:Rrf2 family protein
MRLTRASSYALHAVAFMAQQRSEKPVASHHIAAARGIPMRFLLKVLKPLVSAGLLTSIKGPHGGYALSREPEDISILEIIEAVDGRIRGHAPFAKDGNAALNNKLETICRTSAEATREHLKTVRVSDLVSGRKETTEPRRKSKEPEQED